MAEQFHIDSGFEWFEDRLAVECVRLRHVLPEGLVKLALESLAREIARESVCSGVKHPDEVCLAIESVRDSVAYATAHYRDNEHCFSFPLPPAGSSV